MPLKLLGYAYTVVLYAKLVYAEAFPPAWSLRQADRYRPAVRRELDGIADDIDQHL